MRTINIAITMKAPESVTLSEIGHELKKLITKRWDLTATVEVTLPAKLGRPPIATPDQVEQIGVMLDVGASIRTIAMTTGLTRPVVSRVAAKLIAGRA